LLRDPSVVEKTAISAIFWEGLNAGSAVGALLKVGFSDSDVYAVGVLSGAVPDFGELLESVGISAKDAEYYRECFQDGAILLVVHAHSMAQKRQAREILENHGGVRPS
jgi:hypothetical protein